MKLFFILSFLCAFSTVSYANLRATEAVSKIIPSGLYEGKFGSEKCFVSVVSILDSVTVAIKVNNNQDAFAVLNSSAAYSSDERVGTFSATQSLNFPRYLQGGTGYLNLRSSDVNQVQVSLATVLMDHRGNDTSTFLTCTVSL